jgi:hypothetical protein
MRGLNSEQKVNFLSIEKIGAASRVTFINVLEWVENQSTDSTFQTILCIEPCMINIQLVIVTFVCFVSLHGPTLSILAQ